MGNTRYGNNEEEVCNCGKMRIRESVIVKDSSVQRSDKILGQKISLFLFSFYEV